jgi:hypothetical protein
MSRKRYCHAGYDDEGRAVFAEHGSDGTDTRTIVGAPEDGKPIPPGRGLALVTAEPDGRHVTMEDVITPGPPQVATESYRRNWDATSSA